MESTNTWGITTTLAYFCASEYLRQLEKEKTIALEELKIEVFGKYWQDESCHQVLQLIAGMIDAKFVGEIIDYLCQQKGKNKNFMNLLLAAKCLDEVRNRQVIAKTDNQLFELLKSLIKYDLNYYYRLHYVPEEIQRVRDIRTQAVAAIATTWHDRPDTLPLLKLWATSDDNWDVREAAVQEIIRGWQNETDTLLVLKQCANSNPRLATLVLE